MPDPHFNVTDGKIAFSPDSNFLASFDGSLPALGRGQRKGIILRRMTGRRGQIAFTPDGKSLFVPPEMFSICFWDIASRKEVRHLATAWNSIALAFYPDGKLVAGSNNNLCGSYHLECDHRHGIAPFQAWVCG